MYGIMWTYYIQFAHVFEVGKDGQGSLCVELDGSFIGPWRLHVCLTTVQGNDAVKATNLEQAANKGVSLLFTIAVYIIKNDMFLYI